MNFDGDTIFWLVSGGLLMLSEVIIPGGVVFFLGMAAALVGLAVSQGYLGHWMQASTAWFFTSIVLLISLRQLATRYFGGDSSVAMTDEDLEAIGTEVTVVTPVTPDDNSGRIHFQGSSWPATSLGGPIPKGGRATLSYRDNLVWMVEPVSLPLESDETGENSNSLE